MRTVILIIVGAISLSSAFGNDPSFEERFKMKTGRYTPAEEARREKARLASKQATEEQFMSCEKSGCCTRPKVSNEQSLSGVADNTNEARYRMKYGRSSPLEERLAAAKRAAAEPVLLASAHTCEGDCCKHDR